MKNRRLLLKGMLWALVLTLGSAYIYYDSIFGLPPGIIVGIYAYREYRKRYISSQRRKLLVEFSNTITAMQSALEAGNSIERSLMMASEDMKRMYGGSSVMSEALEVVKRKTDLGISFEKALNDMACELELKEINDFALVLITIKTTGGNAIKVIKETVEKIVSGIELQEELEVMVASKKLEQQIMIFMPAFIILFLRLTSRGFMNPLYGNIIGALIMTVVLAANIGADRLGKYIVNIV